jgi:hypothetical protein
MLSGTYHLEQVSPKTILVTKKRKQIHLKVLWQTCITELIAMIVWADDA